MAEMKSPGADDPSSPEMIYPVADATTGLEM